MPRRYSMRPLPARAYIPGVSPRADRPGSASAPRECAALDVDALARDAEFLHGVDLFNHGFPWEAHEAWEPLWFAAPRDRPERALLQGLIHAAAAAVKARAGALEAARGFVASARAHLERVQSSLFDVPAFVAALHAWAHDPAHPTPVLVLAR